MPVKPILTAVLLLSAIAHASEPLRVLCFNLRYINKGDTGDRTWTARRDQAADVILKDKPDLIGIQEGLRPMLDDIAERVPGYVEIGGGREDGLAKGEYTALLVRADRFTIQQSGTFWLSDTPETTASTTWGNQVVRICTWAKLYDRTNKRAFHFFNTHLDHQTPLARQKGTELIVSRMAACGADGPFILTGDLNARPEDPLHGLLTTGPCGLVDVWAALHPGATPEESVTAHSFIGKPDGSRIDYIYASKVFTPVDSEVLRTHINGVYPSDHYPVRATLAFPVDQPVAPAQ
ncbi:MAG: endonuclease/exonuclease/phosphatase family protein [Akkermansiaceae bacterium]|nr:endonuclease/exonuclease/phosphatase family protein [Akkermansiaceae bacterium]